MPKGVPVTLEERLSQFEIDESTGCHNWTGPIRGGARGGYGNFSYKGKNYLAPMAYWKFLVGEVPHGLEVKHSCHNRLCVNIAHLSVGTHAENMEEMIEAGRNNQPKGEKHPGAKLTELDVQRIKELLAQGNRVCEIAKMYNMGWNAIDSIKTGKSWSHLAQGAN